jgi:hypothetical protein
MIFTKMPCPNPRCGRTLIVQVEMKGRKAKCAKCGYKFYIPDLAPPSPGAMTMIARRFAGGEDLLNPQRGPMAPDPGP